MNEQEREEREKLMKRWDSARNAIANGDTSSWPRDWFESEIDVLCERITEQQATITTITARVAELEHALRNIEQNAIEANEAAIAATTLTGKSGFNPYAEFHFLKSISQAALKGGDA